MLVLVPQSTGICDFNVLVWFGGKFVVISQSVGNAEWIFCCFFLLSGVHMMLFLVE